MNIIEMVRKLLTDYPKMKEFTNNVHIDFTDAEPTNFGLSSNGDIKIKEDLLGNQKRRHNFILYAINQAYTDYDRLTNSSFLLELTYWLEKAADNQEIEVVAGEDAINGELIELSSANAMLFDIPTGNINDGVTYQLQIFADYTVKGEEA